MNLPDFKELTFEDERHIYKLNGQIIPSVTTIMKPLSRELYGDIDADILNAAARRGKIVHEAIENYIKFGIEDIPEEYGGYFEAFMTFAKRFRIEPIGTECMVYHKLIRYAGTIDLPCIIDGDAVLIDTKTSAQVNRMLTGIQLEGYARAFESHGVKFDLKAILHLSRDGKYDYIPYEMKDTESYEVFTALYTVWGHVQKFKGR